MDQPVRTRGMLPIAILLALVLTAAASVPVAPFGSPGTPPLVTPVGAASYERVSALGRATRVTSISLPRLRIKLPVRQGVLGGSISRRYAYHYPATSWPGGGSNTYLYAHAQAGAFLNLKDARKGDLVIMRLVTGRYVKYKVTARFSVAWNAVRWLRPTASERLTLQTCLGHRATSRRLIVLAVPAH